jgi:hypothetical protein
VCSSASVGKLVSCIVDIGHTKTSVSCVDNGEIILGTRYYCCFFVFVSPFSSDVSHELVST